MTININIHAAEWEFKEELPFNITTVNDEVKDFELPLFDDDDNETERILLKDCRVIELIGEDDGKSFTGRRRCFWHQWRQ